MATVYCISNLDNGKRYIGQTTNYTVRTYNNRSRLNRGTHHNERLQSDFDSGCRFEFVALEACMDCDRLAREAYYMWLYQSTNQRFGYNETDGEGRHSASAKSKMARKTVSEETRSKLRDRVGEKNHRSKITDRQRGEIRSRYAAGGVTHMELSKEYGISRSQVTRTIAGKS